MAESRFTATKFDQNKPPMDLLPWEAVEEIARVLDFGRQKYAPHNWRKGFLWTRLAAAALRHIFLWLSGQDKDPESGLSHIAHAACCLMFLIAHIKSNLGKDDRAHVMLAEEAAPPKPKKWRIYYNAGTDADPKFVPSCAYSQTYDDRDSAVADLIDGMDEDGDGSYEIREVDV